MKSIVMTFSSTEQLLTGVSGHKTVGNGVGLKVGLTVGKAVGKNVGESVVSAEQHSTGSETDMLPS